MAAEGALDEGLPEVANEAGGGDVAPAFGDVALVAALVEDDGLEYLRRYAGALSGASFCTLTWLIHGLEWSKKVRWLWMEQRCL